MAIYRDLNLTFTRHPITGDVARLTDMDAIKRSVKTLLLTSVFERPFEPGIGSRLRSLLFEPLDTVTERLVVEEIRRVITLYEPRVTLAAITLTALPDENGLDVVLVFRVLQFPQPVTAQLTLSRIR